MKTRFLLLTALLICLLPFSKVHPTEFSYGVITASHYYNAISGYESSHISIGARLDTYLYEVYVQNIPNVAGDLKLPINPGWQDIYQNLFSTWVADPAPWDEWEGKYYTFYADENENGQFDEGEEASIEWYIPPDSLEPMDFVENLQVTGENHPTITWEGPVASADAYAVRIFPMVNGKANFDDLLFQAFIPEDGSGYYSYTYEGDLFENYGTLAVAVEARQGSCYNGNCGTLNRSRYTVQHPIPAPEIKISWFCVQHRTYEDGRVEKKLLFQLRDELYNYVLDDIVIDAILTDPFGNEVSISNRKLEIYRIAFGRYDGEKGQWKYAPFQEMPEYSWVIEQPLRFGIYHLKIYTTKGECEGDYVFEGLVELPAILSRTIRTRFDRSGNFISTWAVPYYLDPELETSVRAIIRCHKGDNLGMLYVTVPTHMGRLFVPKEIVEATKSEGKRFEMAIQLRTNANNSRSYSKLRKLPQWRLRLCPWRLEDEDL